MEFRIVKNGTNNFTHYFDNKDINLSDFEVIMNTGTFTIQALNGANIPAYGVDVTDIILDAGSGDETFSSTAELRTRLEAVGYTAYYNAGGGGSTAWGSISGTLSAQTDLNNALNGKQATLTDVNFGSFTNGLTAKTALVDADSTNLVDSADSNKAKKVTWLNVWNYIKSKADFIYQAVLVSGTNIKTINGTSILGSGNLIVGGGGAETFTISWDASEYYNTDRSLFNVQGVFYTQPSGFGWNNALQNNIGANPTATGTSVGHCVPYKCKMKSATMLVTNSNNASRDFELRVFAFEANLSGNTNQQTLMSSRPNNGVSAVGASTMTVIDFVVGTQPDLLPNTVITHAVSYHGAAALANISILYTFEKVA